MSETPMCECGHRQANHSGIVSRECMVSGCECKSFSKLVTSRPVSSKKRGKNLASSSSEIQNKELILAWDKGFIEGMRQAKKFLTGKQDSLPDTPSPNPYDKVVKS